MRFEGKVVLVTGAAVGIGRACALEFAREGARVIMLDVDKEKLLFAKEEVAAYKNDVLAFVCDVSDENNVNEVVREALAAFGKIDVLINNAALWRHRSAFVDMDMDVWRKYFDINVTGTALVTQAILPSMLENKYGRIINVASVAGVYGNAKMACYSATKGAIIAFTKALAKEVSDKGVLVNAVSPGSVSSSANPDLDHSEPSELSFMGRTGTGRENASLITYLASEEAGYISGQNIQIDGCRKKQ